MLILQVRQSEVALADGRLDEAHALAVAHNVARHRRGQRLITRLVDALVRRGQEHAAAQRYTPALADCDKAAKLGGNRVDIVALRAAVTDAMAQQTRQQQRRAMALATARRHVNDGELSLGEQLLGAAPADASRAVLLRDDIDHRRRTAGDAVRACAQALRSGDAHRAARELLRARSSDSHHDDLADLAPRVTVAVASKLQDAIEQGQLDQADTLLHHLQNLDAGSPQLRRQQAVLDGLREAWQQIRGGAFAEARVLVSRLLPATDDAPWLKRVAEQLRQADSAISELHAGPFAWLGPAPTRAPAAANAAVSPGTRRFELQPHRMPQPSTLLPTQFLLHVDGVGGFLVLRQPIVTIGPISSPVAADIAVVAEPTLPPATIARVDDDYFLKGGGSVPTLGRLLTSGERLDFSRRCRLTFLLPSAASTTAVIDLSGARLPRADIRRVILMDQDLIIGPASTSHVVAPQLERAVVLHVSQGQLVCQGRDGAMPIGESISVGGVSLVIAPTNSQGSR